MRVKEMPGSVDIGARQGKQPQWEYRSRLMERDCDLSQWAAEGWELVSVVGQPADQCMYYFKRRFSNG